MRLVAPMAITGFFRRELLMMWAVGSCGSSQHTLNTVEIMPTRGFDGVKRRTRAGITEPMLTNVMLIMNDI
jgi:hypothetical protein